MGDDLPELYFRLRDGGAVVFRLEGDNRNRRLEMEPLATVQLRSGEVKVLGDRTLQDRDRAAIAGWVAGRQALMLRRETDDIHRTIDHLNQTAHWAQSKASDAQLDEVTEALLMAMHDLRTVLVRRKAERITSGR